MNALDSPLEALAFNYLSYGLLTVVNNIWTVVAVITAAVSFWRIRASSELPRGKILDGSSQNTLILSPPVEKPAGSEPEQPPEPASTSSCSEPDRIILSPKTVPFCLLDGGEGSTKGKFTLYYCDDEEDGENYGESVDGEVNGDDNVEEVGEGWWSKWEMVMKMRAGDDEWYSYQDMTVINGNVVRLWDGCRRRINEATPLELAVVGDYCSW